jgi:hypothetical protein
MTRRGVVGIDDIKGSLDTEFPCYRNAYHISDYMCFIETEEESSNKVYYIDNSVKVIINPDVFVDSNYFVLKNIKVDIKLSKEIAKKDFPDLIYYTTTLNNLPLREEPLMDGKIIYYIKK